MAREIPLQIMRASRANLAAQSSADGLLSAEPYLITDESRLAVGLGASSFAECLMRGDIGTDTTVSASGAITLSLDGRAKALTLTGAVTLTLAVPSGASFASALVVLTQDATGGRTVSWADSPTQLGSQDLNTDAGGVSVWIAWTPDGGSAYFLTPGGVS